MSEPQPPDLPKDPFHPTCGFKFPKRAFGKQNRQAKSEWFQKHKWLHYQPGSDSVFCHVCVKAYKEKKLNWSKSKTERNFITVGFSNWKKALEVFQKHEISHTHRESTLKVVTVKNDVAEMLSVQHAKEKAQNRKCFLKLLSNVKFLGKQALAFRGHDDSRSNFIQLIKLRGEDVPDMLTWLDKKTNKYTSGTMQNEMLKVMAKNILRTILEPLRNAQFYSLMVDETSDLSNLEQVVFCFR